MYIEHFRILETSEGLLHENFQTSDEHYKRIEALTLDTT